MRRVVVLGGALLCLGVMSACTESSERRMTYIDAAIDAAVDAAPPDMAAPDAAEADGDATDGEATDGGESDGGDAGEES